MLVLLLPVRAKRRIYSIIPITISINNTVRPLLYLYLSAVLGRTKFLSQKPRINEVRG